jgi:hypothetical protein
MIHIISAANNRANQMKNMTEEEQIKADNELIGSGLKLALCFAGIFILGWLADPIIKQFMGWVIEL